MQIYANVFRDGGVLLEDCPAGDHSIPITLNEREKKCIFSLLALESFEIAQALGSLYITGVRTGQASKKARVTA